MSLANTYGLRKIRVDEHKNLISLEYDASRLRETQVAHVLGMAGISITRLPNESLSLVLEGKPPEPGVEAYRSSKIGRLSPC